MFLFRALNKNRDPPSLDTAFHKLPIELNKEIVQHLESDKDIASFRLICRAANNAIDADHLSFWRRRFREKYALREGVSNKKLKDTYQSRAKWLRRGTGYEFFRGHKEQERSVVRVLRSLVNESFQGPVELDEYGRPRCKNQEQLANFVLNSKMLLSDRRPPPPRKNEPEQANLALIAVKLVCSHFLFELEGAKHNVFAVEDSQRTVYSSTAVAPLYLGPGRTELNMDWFLHCLNFFRYHMMNEEAATLFPTMEDLPITQKPSAWRGPLKQGAHALSKHWKGTYSYLLQPQLNKIRNNRWSDTDFYSDLNIDEGKIQSLELNFLEGKSMPWPKIFEKRLESLRDTTGSHTNAQRRGILKDMKSRSIQFNGSGEDLDDEFNALGWLNPLPEQCGISGWQRITMMKYFVDDMTNLSEDNLWAYEGVVLPGGRVILGRWWFASDPVELDNDYNGPFILWAVDPEPGNESP